MKPIPSDVAAERAALGAMLLERDAIVAVAAWLTPEMFYYEKHAQIYEAMLACYARREPPDLVAVATELRRQERYDQVGGLAFLGELAADTPIAVHVEYYARSVEHTATLRRLIETGGQIAALGYDETKPLAETLDQAEQLVFGVAQRGASRNLIPAGKVANAVWAHLGSQEPPALSTGLGDLDRALIGWRPGRMYVVAARPGGGKTGFGMTAVASCCQSGGRALLFSLEMSHEEVGFRAVAGLTGISSQAIEARTLGEAQLTQVAQALGEVEQWDLLVSDISAEHITALRGEARRAHTERPLDLIVVDYLQLVEAEGDRRDLVVSAVARGLKNLSRELGVPVIALAQLNRAVEGRANKTPQLSDLRESGEIEQAADAVVFIHHDPEIAGKAELIIAKQRNGPCGSVTVQFDGPTTTFRPLSTYNSPEGY